MPKSNNPETFEAEPVQARPSTRSLPRSLGKTLLAAVLLLAGAGAGGLAVHAVQQPAVMAPMNPTAINTLTDWSTVTIKGKVVEVFGNKYVVEDDTARALVETGRAGEDGALAKKDDVVTVQGRFEHGFLHAQYIVGADSKTVSLAPPPPMGPHDLLHGLHLK